MKKIFINLFFNILLFYNIFSEDQEIRKPVVRSHLGAGFFAELNKVIDCIMDCDPRYEHHLQVDWTQEFFPYKTHPYENGWGLYFEPIVIAKNRDGVWSPRYLLDQTHAEAWINYDQHLNYRLEVNKVINNYLKINPAIVRKLEQYCHQFLKDYICIGVHVRFASVHQNEIPGGKACTLADYYDEIDSIIKRNKKNKNKKRNKNKIKIFVATDSHYVISEFRKRYSSDLLLYQDAFRANYKEDPHLIYENAAYWISHAAEFHARKPGYAGGESTLLDCLILSKCNYIIHTMSNLSNFACFINPYIKQVFLPKINKK